MVLLHTFRLLQLILMGAEIGQAGETEITLSSEPTNDPNDPLVGLQHALA